jgi:molybdopterin converting factor small subunit
MAPLVEIRLYASLKELEPPSAAGHPVAPGATVGQILDQLKVPLSQVKLVFVNGRKVDLDQALRDGDRVGVFPPVGGG